jgi:putative pyoverdin transport system ATP-binding/permease protein
MGIVVYLYREAWKLLLLATATGLIGGLSGAAVVATIGERVVNVGPLSTLAVTFFGLCLVSLVSKTCSELALLQMTQLIVARMRISLSRKILSTPLKDLQQMGKSGLLVILTNDIDTFAQASHLLPFIFSNAIVIIACLGYMAWVSWQVFLAFTSCLFVCLTLYQLAEQRPARQMQDVREHIDVLYRNFRSLVEGTKELQLNKVRGSAFLNQVIAPGATQFKHKLLRSMMGYTLLLNSGAMSFYLVIGALLFGIPVFLPEQAGVLPTITVISLYLVQPIVNMVMAIPGLRQAEIALQRIHRVDSELRAVQPASPAEDPFATRSSLLLELHGVCHSYPSPSGDERFNLGPIDLVIRQGEIVFIVGGNGSGKTTLAMLLLGLYAPEAGSLRLNGVVVTDANIEQYRRHFSAVFSDFHLFEDLLLDDNNSMTDQAMHYVSLFGMAGKVKVNDGKFSTIDLSTGQRKRLALVSSYLEDRPIYLFDEWACDQDPEFKRIFYAKLLPDLKARGKMVLAITHDDTYFGFADRIVKLEDGMCRGLDSEELMRVPC